MRRILKKLLDCDLEQKWKRMRWFYGESEVGFFSADELIMILKRSREACYMYFDNERDLGYSEGVQW